MPIYFSLETIKRPPSCAVHTYVRFIILSLCMFVCIYIHNIAGGLIKVSMQHGCHAGWPSTLLCVARSEHGDFDSSRTTPKCQTAFQYDRNPQHALLFISTHPSSPNADSITAQLDGSQNYNTLRDSPLNSTYFFF